jgi:PIN domain nuclease of toxin-antitoxin system
MPEQQRIILDTHIWIWLLEQPDNLSNAIIAKINQAGREKQVLIAAISLWEISLLAEKKRIVFKEDILTWLNKALLHPGVVLCPLTADIAARVYKLPGNFHGDPADRMIVATARAEGALLVTRDEEILRYAKAGHIKALLA